MIGLVIYKAEDILKINLLCYLSTKNLSEANLKGEKFTWQGM